MICPYRNTNRLIDKEFGMIRSLQSFNLFFFLSFFYSLWTSTIIYFNDVNITSELFNNLFFYFFKVSNRYTRTMYEICSKLTIKKTRTLHWLRSSAFIANFKHISHVSMMFPYLNVGIFCFGLAIVMWLTFNANLEESIIEKRNQ